MYESVWKAPVREGIVECHLRPVLCVCVCVPCINCIPPIVQSSRHAAECHLSVCRLITTNWYINAFEMINDTQCIHSERFLPFEATQTSEKRGQSMDLGVDSNTDSVSCTSSASACSTLQDTRRNSHSPPELTVSSSVSRVPPVIRVKEEEMHSKCRPPENLGLLTKPPVFQVKNEPMLSESKPPVRLCPISKKQPGLQVKADLVPHESGIVKPISEELPSFQEKADVSPSQSGSDATAGPISERQPSFQVKAQLKQSSGPVSERQLSFQVKAELTAPKSGFLETSGLIFEEQSMKQRMTERMPQVSRSPETAGLVSVGQRCVKVKSEVIPKDDGSPKTTDLVSGACPGYQMNTEPLVKECSFPLPTASLLKMPQICQVKDEMALSSCGSFATPIPSSKPAPSSHVKDGTLLSENRFPLSTGYISAATPSSQVKHDPVLSECKPLVATPPATKMPSSFLVKGGAHSEGVALVTMGPTIPQDKYLPTRKREALESLGKLIRICTSKTKLCDPPPVKCRRKTSEVKSILQ